MMVNFDWFEVRQSHQNDIPTVYKIDSHSMVSSFSKDSFVDRLLNYGDMFLVATETATGNVIGYVVGTHDAVYTKEYPGYIYISRFAVKNKYRRRGIGTIMLLVLENAFMMTGKFHGIVADVRLSNAASVNFFKGNGYEVSKQLSRAEGYREGETKQDRYKVVLYKQFPIMNA
jgi:ribosomal protein S18 acetylase RimI-like enzyme